MSDSNLIKDVCREFGFTYKDLSEKIGMSESSIRSAASTGKISNQLQKAIELFIENIKLSKKVKKLSELKTLLKEIIEE